MRKNQDHKESQASKILRGFATGIMRYHRRFRPHAHSSRVICPEDDSLYPTYVSSNYTPSCRPNNK